MKTKTIQAIIAGVLCALFLSLSSCTWVQKTVPVVQDRDPAGRFIVPVCPQCGQSPVVTGSIYVDGNGHPFAAWHGVNPAVALKIQH
jgi:hypothetical protein